MSDIIRQYVPPEHRKYITDLDLPDAVSPPPPRPLNARQRLLRELLDEHKARQQGKPVPNPRPAPLHKPVTPEEWKRSYYRGYAT